jgi:hypothetical protein
LRRDAQIHFIAEDLAEDWLASIDWDAIISFIFVVDSAGADNR